MRKSNFSSAKPRQLISSNSTRIDKLIQEFQNFKERVRSNSSKQKQILQQKIEPVTRKNSSNGFQNYETQTEKHEKTFTEGLNDIPQICLNKRYSFIANKESLRQQFKRNKQEDHVGIVKMLEQFTATFLDKNEHFLEEKIKTLDRHLQTCQKNVIKMNAALRKKKEIQRRKIAQDKRKAEEQSTLLSQSLTQEYESKMKKMVQLYQEKIKKLDRDNSSKDKITSATTISGSNREINQFQSLLLSKDSEISDLKIQLLQVKNTNQGLQKQLEWSVHTQVMNTNYQKQIEKLQKIINFKNQEIKVLQEQLQNTGTDSFGSKNVEKKNSTEQQLTSSLDTSQAPSQASFKIFLHKSQIFQPCQSKNNYFNLKQLQAQINLLEQQNKNLHSKKDKLEKQFANNEADEERFQQQNTIYKNEIKYLSSALRTVDTLVVKFFSKAGVKVEEVEQLSNDLKCKKYFKERSKVQNAVK